ncbi:SHOCT domain-containing protein [Enterococcus sp. CSURQ0835]|uniref:SHOCT domain-containing protein n=1 Tax=Enterococcus sp. CSURQ0835 TaxID=2681394 RepID=UPI001358E778|nr:SHOCT domain-containing protein [Enterococcus sp. CSURQ0835]
MGFWDSVKQSAKEATRLTSLQAKIRNNTELTDEEREEFSKLNKDVTPDQDLLKHPSRYFKQSAKYGVISIDENKKLFQIGNNTYNTYHFNELNSYELLENGSSVTSGGLGVGRAVVGGVMLGGVGAVLGGVTKKKKQTNFVESLKILVTFKNRNPVSTTIDFIKKKQQKDKKYEKILVQAKETLSGFDYIINTLEGDKHSEVVGAMSNSKPSSTESVADELRKYKSLADDGIITQEEFDKKKKELLGL